MAQTSKGITYPTSGDNIAPLETHFSALAGTANAAIIVLETDIDSVDTDLQSFKTEVGVIPQSGKFALTGPTNTTTPVAVTINFSVPFAVAPTVVATVGSATAASAYFAGIHSVTASQFQARIWRTTGTTAETLALNWIAK
jgi:hypothetical protein